MGDEGPAPWQGLCSAIPLLHACIPPLCCCTAAIADVREMRLASQQADGSSAAVASSSTTTAAAAAAAGTTGLEQSLSALKLGQQPTGRTSSSQAGAAAAAAAAAAPTAAGAAAAVPRAFDVAAGSFQCVWFFCLGERHHKPVVEWLQQQLTQQQQQQQGTSAAAAAADGGATGPAFTVVGTIKEVPQVGARELLALWIALVGLHSSAGQCIALQDNATP